MIKTRVTVATGLAALLSMSLASGAFAGLFGNNDADPELTFCQSAVTMADAVASLEAIGPESTTGDLQTAADGVSQAASDMRNDARNLLEAQVDDIETAVGNLQGYIGDLDSDETIEAATQGAAPFVAEIKLARAALGTVDCEAAIAREVAQQAEDS